MAKQTIKTGNGEYTITIPKQVNPVVKQMIIETLQEGIDEEHIGQMVHEFENITAGVEVLLEHLKDDDIHSKEIENVIRSTIAVYLKRGLEMGKLIRGDPQKVLKITKMAHPDLKSRLKKIKGKKRQVAEYILHSFLLGKQCYETGLSLSAMISIEKQEEYKKQLEEEVSRYIR